MHTGQVRLVAVKAELAPRNCQYGTEAKYISRVARIPYSFSSQFERLVSATKKLKCLCQRRRHKTDVIDAKLQRATIHLAGMCQALLQVRNGCSDFPASSRQRTRIVKCVDQ